jgi:predicted secreted protein
MTKLVIFAIFFTITSFIILPLGIETNVKPISGHADSAPSNPKIGLKFLAISLISFFLTGVFLYLIYKFPELENIFKE